MPLLTVKVNSPRSAVLPQAPGTGAYVPVVATDEASDLPPTTVENVDGTEDEGKLVWISAGSMVFSPPFMPSPYPGACSVSNIGDRACPWWAGSGVVKARVDDDPGARHQDIV